MSEQSQRSTPSDAVLAIVGIAAVIVIIVGSAVLVQRRIGTGSVVTSGPVSGADELPSDQVTLTDQTVVVRGNDGTTLRSIDPDGTTFRLDAGAEGADKIEPGKVLLVTGVAVVKAREVRREGDEVIVSTEPAGIGELLQDADISWSDVAPGAGRLQVWDAPADAVRESGSDVSADSVVEGDGQGDDEQGMGAGVFGGPGSEVAQGDGASTGKVGPFGYTYRTGESGSTTTYDLTVTRDDSLRMKLDIKAELGKVVTEGRIKVERSLLNVLSIKSNTWEGKADITLEAAVGETKEPVKQSIFEIPLSVDYPIVIYGIPFNLSFKVKLLVEPAFTSAQSTLNAKGTVSFGGTAGLELSNGAITPSGAVTAEVPDPVSYLSGLGIGVSGFIVALQVPRVGFGLGWASTNAGVYLDQVTSIGATVGSSVGIVQCYQITVTSTTSAGVDAKFLGKEIEETPVKTEISKTSKTFFTPKVKACET